MQNLNTCTHEGEVSSKVIFAVSCTPELAIVVKLSGKVGEPWLPPLACTFEANARSQLLNKAQAASRIADYVSRISSASYRSNHWLMNVEA